MAQWDITDAGLAEVADGWRAALAAGPDLLCHLYVNDFTPGPGSTELDYEEASWTGYAPAPLPKAGYGPPSVLGHLAVCANPTPAVFEATGPGGLPATVYGYYLTAGGVYVWGERFAGGPRTLYLGDSLEVHSQILVAVLE